MQSISERTGMENREVFEALQACEACGKVNKLQDIVKLEKVYDYKGRRIELVVTRCDCGVGKIQQIDNEHTSKIRNELFKLIVEVSKRKKEEDIDGFKATDFEVKKKEKLEKDLKDSRKALFQKYKGRKFYLDSDKKVEYIL